jgi:hypothetical protein
MKSKIAHARAELYRVRRNLVFVFFVSPLVALVIAGLAKLWVVFFIAVIVMVPAFIFFFMAIGSQAPFRIRLNKKRYSKLLGNTIANTFPQEWSDSVYPGWMARDYYGLVYNGVNPDVALNWICAKWMIFEKWDSPLVIVRDKDKFPSLESFIVRGISVSDFYRLWNMQLTSSEVMKYVVENDLDSSLVASLVK